MARGGRAIIAATARDAKGRSRFVPTLDPGSTVDVPDWLVTWVCTEYGIVNIQGCTDAEKARKLISIAHPDDRADLVRQAKEARLLYPDQVFFPESGRLYPEKIATTHTFKDGFTVRFRAIKPSDEDEMRRLFYRFSDRTVYYRYFSPIKTMPHDRMQEYVNVDYRTTMSVVGVIEEAGREGSSPKPGMSASKTAPMPTLLSSSTRPTKVKGSPPS